MRIEKKILARGILFAAKLGSLLWLLTTGSLAVTLLCVADTHRGRLFAAASIMTAVLPLAITLACRKSAGKSRAAALWLGAIWALAVGLTLSLAPDGGSRERGRVVNAFNHTTAVAGSFSRYSIANLLPEGDQLLLGLQLIPLIDPLVSRKDAKSLQGWTASLYRELERQADFHALGSVMSEAYARLLNPSERSAHSYVYVPDGLNRNEPRPVLVFFHGSGGNFKAYLWILSKLADRLNYVLVAPGGGFGNWTKDESLSCLERALTAAADQAKLDLSRVHIIGLSNGGLAITQLAASPTARFASMTFLSPVFDTREIDTAAFARRSIARPALIITGATDNRVPLDYVENNVADIRQLGGVATFHVIADADHFALFSHREQMIGLMETWYREHQP